MSHVARLKAQLEVAELEERLEAARTKMHGDRSRKNVKAYKAACAETFAARAAFRETYPTEAQPGDAVAKPATVRVPSKVQGTR